MINEEQRTAFRRELAERAQQERSLAHIREHECIKTLVALSSAGVAGAVALAAAGKGGFTAGIGLATLVAAVIFGFMAMVFHAAAPDAAARELTRRLTLFDANINAGEPLPTDTHELLSHATKAAAIDYRRSTLFGCTSAACLGLGLTAIAFVAYV